jgi:hypothetical protein
MNKAAIFLHAHDVSFVQTSLRSVLRYYEVGLLVAGLFTGFVQSVLVGVREGNENVVVQLAEAIEKIKP